MTTNRDKPGSSAPSKPADHRSLADFSLSDMAEMAGVPRRMLGRWFAEAGLEPVRTFANAKRFTMPQLVEVLSIRGTANAELAEAQARKMAALAGIAELRFAREREKVVETALATEIARRRICGRPVTRPCLGGTGDAEDQRRDGGQSARTRHADGRREGTPRRSVVGRGHPRARRGGSLRPRRRHPRRATGRPLRRARVCAGCSPSSGDARGHSSSPSVAQTLLGVALGPFRRGPEGVGVRFVGSVHVGRTRPRKRREGITRSITRV